MKSNKEVAVYYFSTYDILIEIYYNIPTGRTYSDCIRWHPEKVEFTKHKRLQYYIIIYPEKLASVFLNYVFYYQNYDFLSFALNTGGYDSIIDDLIQYATYHNYTEIALLLVRYSNSISKSTSFSL